MSTQQLLPPELAEGDLINICEDDKFYAEVPRHFIYKNRRGDFKKERFEVTANDHFDYFLGTYVVTKTTFDGGGTGHGASDMYPDGHHVFCEHTENKHLKLDFYQSGCFTAMMPHKKAIGKARLMWITNEAE